MNSIQLLLTYEEVFGESKKVDLIESLTGISKTTLLKLCSHLLGLYYRKSNEIADVNSFIHFFFSSVNADYANDVYDKVLQLEREVGKKYILVNPRAVLGLLNKALELKGNESKSAEESERIIFEALLVINEDATKNESLGNDKLIDELGKDAIFHLMLKNQVPYIDYTNVDIRDLIYSELARAIMFFEFMESNPDLNKHLEVFRDEFKVDNWKSFLKIILDFVFKVAGREKPGHTMIRVPAESNDITAVREYLVLGSRVEIEGVDFLSLRDKPLVELEDGEFLVLSELFLYQKLHKSLYFLFKRINDGLGIEGVKDFRGHVYASMYSEKWVTKTLISKMFSYGKHIKVINDDDMTADGFEGGIDFYVRDNKNIFLFETKDQLFNKDIKTSYNHTAIIDELKSKLFGYRKENGNWKREGILQLAYNIKKILDRDYPDDLSKAKSVNVYPIILIHDDFFDLPTIGWHINQWFEEAFKELGVDLDNYRDLVHDVVLVPISTLVMVQEALGDKKIKLNEEIKAYHKSLKGKSAKSLEDHIGKVTTSFSDFLKRRIKKKGYWNLSKLHEFIKDGLF